MVLLITAIASLVAYNLLGQQQVDTRRATNSLHWEQAYMYSIAVEAWGLQLLVRDNADSATKDIDDGSEVWATDVGTLPVDDGQITGEIQDLQGRFNLNNLVDATSGKSNVPAVAQFQRLLEALAIDQLDLADKIVDWIDPDEITQPSGGEDGEYLSMEIPYRTSNQFMASVTELRLIEGVTPSIYRKLEPFVTALPTATPVNINTAAAPVLMSLGTGISASAAESLVGKREAQPFKKPAEFIEAVIDAAGQNVKIDPTLIDVRSNYFLIQSKASFGDGFATLSSIIARSPKGSGIHVVMRSQER